MPNIAGTAALMGESLLKPSWYIPSPDKTNVEKLSLFPAPPKWAC